MAFDRAGGRCAGQDSDAGRDPSGFTVTILIGIAGALLGGYLAPLIGWTPNATWERYAAATGGAVILLALYRMIVARRGR